MIIYVIQVLLLLFFGNVKFSNNKESTKRVYIFLAFFLLTVVAGLRDYAVGVDTITYVRLFENADLMNVFSTRYEVGFIYYCRLLHLISANPHFFLLVSSAICIGTVCVFVFRYSKNPSLSLLLYLMMGPYFGQMNTIRQSIAMAITMWAFMIVLSSATKKNIIIAGILIVGATLFHYIAILSYIPLIVYMVFKRTHFTAKQILIRSLALAIVAFIGYAFIIRIVSLFFPQYSHYLGGAWSDSNYMASLLNTLVVITFSSVGSYIFKNRKLTDTQLFAIVACGASIVLYTLSMRMEFWGRAASMFVVYTYIIWAPEFVSEASLKGNRYVLYILISMMSLAYMLITLVLRPEWSGVVPYIWGGF